MGTTHKWIEEKISDYNNDPRETLLVILSSTVRAIQQFVNAPFSVTSKGVLEACLEHDKLFLDAISQLKHPPSISSDFWFDQFNSRHLMRWERF